MRGLMEKGRMRPPDALRLGFCGMFLEGSFIEGNLTDQSAFAIPHPPAASAGYQPISIEYIENSSILRQTRNRWENEKPVGKIYP